jgi:hypothetical protein
MAAMGLVLTATVGAAIWIILWATGLKSFDGFLIGMFPLLVHATVRIVTPYLANREE